MIRLRCAALNMTGRVIASNGRNLAWITLLVGTLLVDSYGPQGGNSKIRSATEHKSEENRDS